MRVILALYAILSFMACITSNDSPSKPKLSYEHFADTLYHADMPTWGEDTTETDYKTALTWSSASVAVYQDSVNWSLGSVSFTSPHVSSSKPVYWDGTAIVIKWDRFPKNWEKVILKFSKKDTLGVN